MHDLYILMLYIEGFIVMSVTVDLEVDATGLTCPLPLLKAKKALNSLESGQKLRIIATDPGSERDFQVFAEQSGNILLEHQQQAGTYTYLIEKK
jgi:tRNA 2-thiouridine synthesizing protein A